MSRSAAHVKGFEVAVAIGWRAAYGLPPMRRRVSNRKVRTDEISIRLGAFALVFAAIAVWEVAAPRRTRSYSRITRWPSNLIESGLNQVIVRVVLPVTIVGLAITATNRGWASTT